MLVLVHQAGLAACVRDARSQDLHIVRGPDEVHFENNNNKKRKSNKSILESQVCAYLKQVHARDPAGFGYQRVSYQ